MGRVGGEAPWMDMGVGEREGVGGVECMVLGRKGYPMGWRGQQSLRSGAQREENVECVRVR